MECCVEMVGSREETNNNNFIRKVFRSLAAEKNLLASNVSLTRRENALLSYFHTVHLANVSFSEINYSLELKRVVLFSRLALVISFHGKFLFF